MAAGVVNKGAVASNFAGSGQSVARSSLYTDQWIDGSESNKIRLLPAKMADLFGDLPPPAPESFQNKIADIKKDDESHDNKEETNSPDSVPFIGSKRLSVECSHENEDLPSKRNKGSTDCKNVTTSTHAQVFSLCSSFAERTGERDDMQDAHCMEDSIDLASLLEDNISNLNRLAYYGVFDGHAGDKASTYASKHLKDNILKRFPSEICPSFDKDLKRCLIEAFKQTDEDFLKEASKANPSWKDGSTGICCLVVNNTLYVANIGDSKALLIRGNKENENEVETTSVISLSKDHSPTHYDERMRIQKAGGTVQDGRVLGILEVSRSFGDGRFKHCGVTCLPDVTKRTLTENDRYVVLACDGLWKGFTVNEAMEEINKSLKTHCNLPLEERLKKTCQSIASDAIRKGSSDNVTVIIVAVGNY